MGSRGSLILNGCLVVFGGRTGGIPPLALASFASNTLLWLSLGVYLALRGERFYAECSSLWSCRRSIEGGRRGSQNSHPEVAGDFEIAVCHRYGVVGGFALRFIFIRFLLSQKSRRSLLTLLLRFVLQISRRVASSLPAATSSYRFLFIHHHHASTSDFLSRTTDFNLFSCLLLTISHVPNLFSSTVLVLLLFRSVSIL